MALTSLEKFYADVQTKAVKGNIKKVSGDKKELFAYAAFYKNTSVLLFTHYYFVVPNEYSILHSYRPIPESTAKTLFGENDNVEFAKTIKVDDVGRVRFTSDHYNVLINEKYFKFFYKFFDDLEFGYNKDGLYYYSNALEFYISKDMLYIYYNEYNKGLTLLGGILGIRESKKKELEV